MKATFNFTLLRYGKFLCTLTTLMFLAFAVNAATSIPAGNVSGTWSANGSPYLVEGDIRVPAGATLTIEPGVVVEFQSWYGLVVNGSLEAAGTASQQIVFTATFQKEGIPCSGRGVDT